MLVYTESNFYTFYMKLIQKYFCHNSEEKIIIYDENNYTVKLVCWLVTELATINDLKNFPNSKNEINNNQGNGLAGVQ